MRTKTRLLLATGAFVPVLLAANAPAPSTVPKVDLRAGVSLGKDGQVVIEGEMTLRGWRPAAGHCLYVPYEDERYGTDRGAQRRMDVMTGRRTVSTFYGGNTAVEVNAPVAAQVTEDEAVIRLALPESWKAGDPVTVRFSSRMPVQDGEDGPDKVFDGFYPLPLGSCPGAEDTTGERPLPLTTETFAKIQVPPGFTYAGPTQGRRPDGVLARITGRSLVFAMSRYFRVREFQVGSVRATMYYHSPGFADLADTIQKTFPVYESFFGPFPYPDLTIIETSELQRHGLPGVIALNRPRQALFSAAQKDYLNWNHWMITRLIGDQWYGAAIAPEGRDDGWLTAGIVEFALDEALRSIPERYNLFADSKWLSVTFLEMGEYSAAAMRQFTPFAVLTDKNFKTADPRELQDPFLFVKHAIAMRQAMHAAGREAFRGFTRSLTQAYLHDALSPKEFHEFIGRLPSPFPPEKRLEIAKTMASWWTEQGWPDFAIAGMEVKPLEGGVFQTDVTVEQQGAVDFAPLVHLQDEQGQNHYGRAERHQTAAGPGWKARFVTDSEPEDAWVDPGHEAFDEDRFDNTTEAPKVRFFPGSAKNLADDGYTVIWIPYPFRRPGEPAGIGLQGALFRYIQGGFFYTVEVAPSEKLTSYKIRRRYQAPNVALHGDLQAEQDFEGDRKIEATIVRSPLFPGPLHVSLNLALRHKQRVGQPDSAHGTGAAGFSLKPAGATDTCFGGLSAEIEHAPERLAKDFNYERKMGVLQAGCAYGRTSLTVRGFAGRVDGGGTFPEQAYFKPTELTEARLRLDVRGLPVKDRIYTVGSDLLFPLAFPLPSDSLVLTRRLKGRLFYDWGFAPKTRYQESAEFRSAGTGLIMPLGGDLSGAGSISITRLSFLVVLYTGVDGEVSRKPRLLFDLSGEL